MEEDTQVFLEDTIDFPPKTNLFEIAWEVCNQVGGIYTVIRSKLPAATKKWGRENYFLIGPYFEEQVAPVFDPVEVYSDPVGRIVKRMREAGYDVHYGYWLVSGKPKVVLFNPYSVYPRLGEIKYNYWANHYISLSNAEELLDQAIAFGFLVKEFFRMLLENEYEESKLLLHFHEWIAGGIIPEIRRENLDVKIVFTTHATLLGRYLAMNDTNFYNHLEYYQWDEEADRFNIRSLVEIERAAAHGAHIFSTVSDVTARECNQLLGRQPDAILPNGLNVQRYEVNHEVQNAHRQHKEKIHEFVMGHFFQNYSFDLDNTLYFFTSGRFEYHNKGYDLTLEALARLNWKLQQGGIDKTVVTFFITRQPVQSINPDVLQSKAQMEEINRTCDEIERFVGNRLFYRITANNSKYKFPNLNEMVEEYYKLKLRRNVQSWKSGNLPPVTTHILQNDGSDPILNYLRMANLLNHPDDKVKVVYHPDFLSSSNPLFRMDYSQFLRGCHLGIFPSYYEPWGYTPLECLASGVPAVTSDLSGFGNYIAGNIEEPEENGMFIVKRNNKGFNDTAEELSNLLLRFVLKERRDRIALRYKSENLAQHFDWSNLRYYYDKAHIKALEK